MASHDEVGRLGEEWAKKYLKKAIFDILHRNWKYSYYEIDIIGCRENVLHIIEIKTRSSRTFGWPEDDVGYKKIEKLMIAAEAYLEQHPQWERVQYDILSISIFKHKPPEYYFITDVSL